MEHICFNGAFFQAGTPLVSIDNPVYKWGEGLFETIRVVKGRILLEHLHWERLSNGLKLLGMEPSLPQQIAENIRELCRKNNCLEQARVRLSVFRAEGNKISYGIEAIEYLRSEQQEWRLGVFPYARKAIDVFSNLKTVSHLPYAMAGQYAKENNFDEVIVLNTENRIADCSRSNLFYIKDQELYTPSLNEGGIAGVMRSHLISQCKASGIAIHQAKVKEEHLLEADEVFLTNALMGIQPVGFYKNKQYSTQFIQELYRLV